MDVTAGEVTKLIEYLDNCRGLISNVDAEIPIDHQIQTLKMDLRFIRTYLKGCKGKVSMLDGYREEIRMIVQNEVSEILSLFFKPPTDRSMIRDLALFVSNVTKKMEGPKESIRNYYTWTYLESLGAASMMKEDLKELVDSLLDNLKDLQICGTNLIVSLKKQIEALEEKVLFVRNFLSWLVDQRDSKDSIQNEKLTGLLTRIQSVILRAVYLSHFCFVSDVQENVYLKCSIRYFVRMMKHIELEVREVYVEFLKDSKSSQPDSLPVNLLTLVSIDSLLNILMKLLESESTFMVPLKDKIGTLNQKLRFLRALLMDTPPRKHNKHEEVDGLLTNIEAFISNAVSSVHSIYVDEMKEETINEMNILLSAFLDKIKLIESEVRDNYIEVPLKPQFKFLGTDELGIIDEYLAEILYEGRKRWKNIIILDDVWNIDAWNDLGKYFLDDQNGSRILITSWIYKVPLQVKPDSSPHFLRLFSEEESMKWLQEKLFKAESCPMELVEISEQIARNCKGLPLAVVLIAGILAGLDKKVDEWKQVAASLSTLIVNDSTPCLDILQLEVGSQEHEAANAYADAAHCYKKTNTKESILCLEQSVNLFLEIGRLNMSARYYKEIAELYEQEQNLEQAINYYGRAADLFQNEDVTTSADQCKQKIAQFAAQLEQYQKSVEIYVEIARHSGNPSITTC